jgi:hypothetical protein
MPSKEPAPLVGTALHPAPKVSAAVVVPGLSELPEFVAVELLLSLPPQAARPKALDSAMAAIPERRSVLFMSDPSGLCFLLS